MKRSSFLKSLFVLVASPKSLAELKTQPAAPAFPSKIGREIFNNLKFVVADYELLDMTPERVLHYFDQTGYLLIADRKQFNHFEAPTEKQEVITPEK